MSTRLDVPRDKFGRPLIVPPEGGKRVPYTRVTTYVGALEDTYKLQLWQQRMTAIGLADRPDLLLAVAAHRDDRDRMDEITGQAKDAAQAGAAATTGTAIHALTERVDRGEPLPALPPAYVADLEAYRAATTALRSVAIEHFVVCDGLKVAGTADRLVEMGGQLYIADVKTGSIEYGVGKIAMQLAAYAHGCTYDPGTSERAEHGASLEHGIIIHLPAGQGTCTLHWVDLTQGWAGVQLAAQVRQWRGLRMKHLTAPFAA